jgi:hypothetical protein
MNFNSVGRSPRTHGRPRAPRARTQIAPIYDPTRMLAGRSLKRAANALTNLEIRPQVSALARSIAATQRQGRATEDLTAGYFRDLGVQAQQSLAAQQGVSDRLNSTLQGIGDQTQQQIGAAGQTAQAQLAPLQQSGLDGGSFAQLAREIMAQQGLAATNSQTSRTFGAQQGANFEGLTANQMGTGTLRGQERLGQIANATLLGTQEARGRQADLLASRGATFTKNLGALRDSERNYDLAVNTLGLNTQKAQLDAATNAARLKQSGLDRQARAAAAADRQALGTASFIARWGITPQALKALPNPGQWLRQNAPYYTSRRGSGGGGGLTRVQAHAAFGNIDAATRSARDMLASGNGTGYVRSALAKGYYEVPVKDARGHQIYDASGAAKTRRISIPRVADNTLVNAAMDLAVNGYLSPANVGALHRYGLKVGGRYRYLKGHRPPPGGVGPPSPVYG